VFWLVLVLLLVFGVLGIRHPWKWFKETRMGGVGPEYEKPPARPAQSSKKRKLQRWLEHYQKWLGDYLILRIALAAIVFRAAFGGLSAIFVDLATTDDWVLEYRYWIIAGLYLVSTALAVVIFMASRPKDAEG
jgi:hypothetical protein